MVGLAYILLYFQLPGFWGIAYSVAGWGVLELGITEMFQCLTRTTRTTGEQALALAFCQRFIWVLNSTPGAIVHLRGGHLPDSFSIEPGAIDG